MPAHPKLRSSCDGCGMAKVKCDRTQPECGRCASHSMKCVYGVSRKMGKPPREKMRLKTSSNPPGHDGLRGAGPPPPLGPGKMLDRVYSSFYHGPHGALHPGMNGPKFPNPPYHPGPPGLTAGLNCGPDAHMEDVLAAWEPLEHDPHHHGGGGGGFLVNMDALDPVYGDYLDPALPLLAAHDFGGEWSLPPDAPAAAATTTGADCGGCLGGGPPGMTPFGPLPMPESPEMGGDSPTSPAKPTTSAAAWSNSSSSGTTTTMTTRSDSIASSAGSSTHDGGGRHDCVREARAVLGSLSPARLSRMLGRPGDAALPTPSAGGPDGVPLDAVLQLNREAGARLGRLLGCGGGCARTPSLALLYASIVARMLAWYQQAAASCAAAAATSWPGSRGDGGGGLTAQDDHWDATTIVVADGTCPPSCNTTTTAAGGPGGDVHVMALGAFSIDDLRVQGALKMQLLAGEMRRAARLVDLFAAFGASAAAGSSGGNGLSSTVPTASLPPSPPPPPPPPPSAAFADDGVEALCLGLEAWLRGEHARIDGLLRAQLRELS